MHIHRTGTGILRMFDKIREQMQPDPGGQAAGTEHGRMSASEMDTEEISDEL